MDRDRIRIMETLETAYHSDTYIAYGPIILSASFVSSVAGKWEAKQH